LSFLDKPREARWRPWLFRLHLGSGLTIGLWAIVMGLSGSALVFKHEIEAFAEPEIFALEVGSERASLDEAAARIRKDFPDFALLQFRGLEYRDRAFIARIARRAQDGSFKDLRQLYFHPATGELLYDDERFGGVFGFLEELHYYLLLDADYGMQINSAIGAVFAFMCASGLVLWWPGRSRWTDGLKVRWSARWKRKNYDLHRALGFWAATPLLVMASTGFYFGFPAPVIASLAVVFGEPIEEYQTFFDQPKVEPRDGGPKASLDALYARREELMPSGVEVSRVVPQLRPDAPVVMYGSRPNRTLFGGYGAAYLDPHTGSLLGQADTARAGWAVHAAMMATPIHFGKWGGIGSKALWLLLGLAPGTLFLSGFLMWRNRVSGRTAPNRPTS